MSNEDYNREQPVVISGDGFKVIIHDSLPPEANAMTMAMYSRDPRSFLVHLQEVLKKGAKNFMAQFYVGYGHKSIGDCGTTNICAEEVSMLAAKEIQRDELYNGQEASTRYLKMTAMPVRNPLQTREGEEIQNRWMALYSRALEELVPYLTKKYPRLETEDQKVYDKAIKARAFDIARSFLPAGCTTYVGWHTNLRQARDHIYEMRFHPLEEVRKVAEAMLEGLKERYPSSFSFKQYPEQDEYMKQVGETTYEHLRFTTFEAKSNIDLKWLLMESDDMRILKHRPAKAELPDKMKRYGTIRFRFPLDFGSFRDLQRHRSCTQPMPLLTTQHGFHPWYLNSLPAGLRMIAEETIRMQQGEIQKIPDAYIRQYYIAMGYQVMCEVTAGLPSAVYIAELRSSQAVHPTLRPIAQEIGRTLLSILPDMAIYCDTSPDEWSTIRGKHDIVKKD